MGWWINSSEFVNVLKSQWYEQWLAKSEILGSGAKIKNSSFYLRFLSFDLFNICFVSRNIEIFQQLQRWDGIKVRLPPGIWSWNSRRDSRDIPLQHMCIRYFYTVLNFMKGINSNTNTSLSANFQLKLFPDQCPSQHNFH